MTQNAGTGDRGLALSLLHHESVSFRAHARRALCKVSIAVIPALALAGTVGLTHETNAAGSPCGAVATSTTSSSCTYTNTTLEGTFTVPAHVTTVHVVAVGAAAGGAGASVTADIPVASNSTYYLEVGVGGGNPGVGNPSGSAGGGASDFQICSVSVCVDTGTANDPRLIVAGGGGGGGGGVVGGGGGGGGEGFVNTPGCAIAFGGGGGGGGSSFAEAGARNVSIAASAAAPSVTISWKRHGKP